MRSLPNHATSFDISRELHPGVFQPNQENNTSLTIIHVGNMAAQRLVQLTGPQQSQGNTAPSRLDNPTLSVIHDDEIAAAITWRTAETHDNKTARSVWSNLRRITHSYGHHAYPIIPTAFNTVALRKGEDGSVNLALQPAKRSQDPAVIAIREEREHFLNVLRKLTGYVPLGVEKSDIGYHIGVLPPEMPSEKGEEIRSMLGYVVGLELFRSDLNPTAILTSRSAVNLGFEVFNFGTKPEAHYSALTLAEKETVMARASIQPAPTEPIERTLVNGADVPATSHSKDYYGTMQDALASYVKKSGNGKSPAQLADQVAWLKNYQEEDVPPQRQTSPTDNELLMGPGFSHLSSTSP